MLVNLEKVRHTSCVAEPNFLFLASEYEDAAVSLPGKSFPLMAVVLIEDALDILKSHRQQHMCAKLELLQIPLPKKEWEQRLPHQFLCRYDLFELTLVCPLAD